MSSSSVKLEMGFLRLFGDVCWTTSWCRVNIRFTFGVDSSDGSNEFVLKWHSQLWFQMNWFSFTWINHWNKNSVVYHWENFSERRETFQWWGKWNKYEHVFCLNAHLEVYDFVFVKQLLIGHFPMDNDYIHWFHHHLNPNWY